MSHTKNTLAWKIKGGILHRKRRDAINANISPIIRAKHALEALDTHLEYDLEKSQEITKNTINKLNIKLSELKNIQSHVNKDLKDIRTNHTKLINTILDDVKPLDRPKIISEQIGAIKLCINSIKASQDTLKTAKHTLISSKEIGHDMNLSTMQIKYSLIQINNVNVIFNNEIKKQTPDSTDPNSNPTDPNDTNTYSNAIDIIINSDNSTKNHFDENKIKEAIDQLEKWESGGLSGLNNEKLKAVISVHSQQLKEYIKKRCAIIKSFQKITINSNAICRETIKKLDNGELLEATKVNQDILKTKGKLSIAQQAIDNLSKQNINYVKNLQDENSKIDKILGNAREQLHQTIQDQKKLTKKSAVLKKIEDRLNKKKKDLRTLRRDFIIAWIVGDVLITITSFILSYILASSLNKIPGIGKITSTSPALFAILLTAVCIILWSMTLLCIYKVRSKITKLYYWMKCGGSKHKKAERQLNEATENIHDDLECMGETSDEAKKILYNSNKSPSSKINTKASLTNTLGMENINKDIIKNLDDKNNDFEAEPEKIYEDMQKELQGQSNKSFEEIEADEEHIYDQVAER